MKDSEEVYKITIEEKAEWFDKATRFQIEGTITLVMKKREKGVGHWAIIDSENNTVMNSNMEWEPADFSRRDESFLIRTLFPLDSAMAQWEQYKMFAT